MYAFEVTLHLSIFSLDISLITSSQQVQTSEQGYNSGRLYYFGVPSQEERALWVDGIKKAIESAAIAERRRTGILNRVRLRASSAYHSRWVQGLVALLILANFVSNATQCQLLPPPGSATDSLFNTVDLFFTGARLPHAHTSRATECGEGRGEGGMGRGRATRRDVASFSPRRGPIVVKSRLDVRRAAVFGFELAVNMFVTPLPDFFADGW